MTPTAAKIHRPVVLLAVILAGCGPTKPPDTGLDDAMQRLQVAREAGASTYAPLELRSAEERLSAGRAAADKRDYAIAAQLADESEANSELAAVKSRLGKAREKAEARARENARLRQELGIEGDSNGAQP
jgi:hypothetical protein